MLRLPCRFTLVCLLCSCQSVTFFFGRSTFFFFFLAILQTNYFIKENYCPFQAYFFLLTVLSSGLAGML